MIVMMITQIPIGNCETLAMEIMILTINKGHHINDEVTMMIFSLILMMKILIM